MVEGICRDLEVLGRITQSNNPWSVILLRYFKPVGAHASGLTGENPNNLILFITQVAIGKREYLSVFGGDYNTSDGAGVRDCIHVVDLAKGHVKAVSAIEKNLTGVNAINLGTGNGQSVLEFVSAFEKQNEIKVPYKIEARRPSDIASCYANADKAKQLLGWQAALDINAMVKDSWHWQECNPEGYK